MQSIIKIINKIAYILCFFSPGLWNRCIFYTRGLVPFQVLGDQMWLVAAVLDTAGLDTPELREYLFNV